MFTRARSALLGLAAIMALAACAPGSTANAVGAGGAPSSTNSRVVEFKETEYTLTPTALTLKPGTYTFRVQNVGQFPHDLHVATSADGTEVGGSAPILAGGATSFTVTLKPGQYTLWCSVGAHRSLGMEGTLTVQ